MTARTTACPTPVLPSVTKILRNFGSQVISRSWRSSAILGTSSMGNARSTPWPDLSSRAPTRTRLGGAAQPPCRCVTSVGPASSRTSPKRHGTRSRKNKSWLWCTVVVDSSSPNPDCSRQRSRSDRQRWHASRGGYCTVPQSAAHLQLEPTERGGGSQTECGARAQPRRQQRLTGPQNGILALRSSERRNHASAPLRIAAPEQRPRS